MKIEHRSDVVVAFAESEVFDGIVFVQVPIHNPVSAELLIKESLIGIVT
jgi:hypothetical protein